MWCCKKEEKKEVKIAKPSMIPLFGRRFIFYDTTLLPMENGSPIDFFTIPLGLVDVRTGFTKDACSTNMTVSRAVSVPQIFDLYGVSYDAPIANDTDINILHSQNFKFHSESCFNFINTSLSIIPTNKTDDYYCDMKFVPINNYITNYMDITMFYKNKNSPLRITSNDSFSVQIQTNRDIKNLSQKQPLIISLHGILFSELR